MTAAFLSEMWVCFSWLNNSNEIIKFRVSTAEMTAASESIHKVWSFRATQTCG